MTKARMRPSSVSLSRSWWSACYNKTLHLFYLLSLFNKDTNKHSKIPMSRDFPRASPSVNPSEQPCQPSENPVHPYSFTWINPFWVQIVSQLDTRVFYIGAFLTVFFLDVVWFLDPWISSQVEGRSQISIYFYQL